ncbi:MAG: APC family permease [Methylocella sp.]
MDDAPRALGRQSESGAERPLLTTPWLVFVLVAAAAPLAAVIGNLPIALARGNGAGTPAAFLFAAVTLLCFSVGYAAMSRRVVNTGAFYTYVAKGLGRPAGVGAAFTALIAYISFTIGLAAFVGYFLDLVLSTLGVHVSWLVYAAGGIAIVGVLGYLSVDLSAKLIGALIAAEIIILLIFDISVLVAKGAAALPLESFSPHEVLSPGLGISLMVAFTSFIGFESAALYGEETKDPTRSVPIAIYVSVILIGAFYLFTAWVTIGALGPEQTGPEAIAQGGMLMFSVFTRYSGEIMSDIAGVLVCTSLLASYLAIHNAAARYIFALSRENLLPRSLGYLHPTRYSPSNASVVVTAITIVCIAAFGLTGLDPYAAGVPVVVGFGTLGIVFLQGFAAIAILAYFWRLPGAVEPWVLVVSTLGALGLIAATALAAANFKLLATSDLPAVGWLPLIYPVTVAIGVGFALWLRSAKPKVYSALS